MTIKEKAIKVELPVEKVAALAAAAGIDAEDVERKLETPESISLGTAVKKYLENDDDEPKKESGSVRFWTKAINHTVALPGGKTLKFKTNALVLDKKRDAETIKMIRNIQNVSGEYGINEVVNKPHEDESEEQIKFGEMLEKIVYTGAYGEKSKAGVKAVRALFSDDELIAMEEYGFDPRRLIMKALRTKSLKPINN